MSPRLLPWLLLIVLAAFARTVSAKDAESPEQFRNTKVMRLEPFEHVRGYPATVKLKGKMQTGYRFSEALLVRPDGSAVVVDDVETKGSKFDVTLKLARGKGIYRLALTGTTDRDRTHHGARIRFYVGVPDNHPDDPVPEDVKPDRRIPGEVLAADLFRRVNAHRKKLKLNALEWQEPLAQAARLHAAECVKRKKLDHKFPEIGTIAWRVGKMYGFDKLVYKRPDKKPSRSTSAKSYLPTVLDARRGLEPIMHRWQRFAAFCVPMTSDLITHGACGIARAKHGSLYIVFVFAQINGKRIPKLTEAAHEAAVREAASELTLDEERPDKLRELALWLSAAARKQARAYERADDPALRAAALDALLLVEPASTRRTIEQALEAAGRAYANLEAGTRPPNRNLGLVTAVRRLRYAPDLVDRATQVEGVRKRAANKSLQRALKLGQAGDPEAARRALERVVEDWPGTPAAEQARKRL